MVVVLCAFVQGKSSNALVKEKGPQGGRPIVNIGAEARLFPLVPVSMLSYVLLPLQR